MTKIPEVLKNFLPAVAAAQKSPNDRGTVEKVSPPAEAAINALNSILAVSSLPADDSITNYASALFINFPMNMH